MGLDHRHRDKERFAVDRDSDGMVFDLVGAYHTVARKGTGMLVAIELDMILQCRLPGALNQLRRFASILDGKALWHRALTVDN
jgi:uncharacterized protein (UPF0548 family)